MSENPLQQHLPGPDPFSCTTITVVHAYTNHPSMQSSPPKCHRAGKCGNPLCRQPVVWKEPGKRFNFDAREVEMLPSNHYCTPRCEGVVARLGSQLGDPMARLKPEIRQRLQQASHGALRSVHQVP